MEELLRLLAEYEAGIADLTDEALDELLANIRAEAQNVLDGSPTDEQLETLETAANAVAGIEAEQATRAAAAEENAQRAEGLRARILGQEGDAEPEAEPEADPEVEAETDPEVEPEVPEVEAEVEPERQPVAAAATRRPTTVTRAVARRPQAMEPRNRTPEPERAPMTLIAAANLPDIQAGSVLETPMDLARAMMSAFQAARGYRGPRAKVPVARLGGDPRALYGDERYLSRDAIHNANIIDTHASRESIVAAGGVCVAPNVNYDMPTIGTDARPVRDSAMARFGADRGGVSTFPMPILSDVAGAVDIWTEANDQNPSDPATKPCLTVTCPDPDVTMVEAITRCFEFGNFRARFFPEQVRAWVDLGAIQHARTAETELLTAIGVGSTQVSSGQLLGATIDILTTLDRAVAAQRSRWRLGDGELPLRFVAPRWLLAMMRTDIARGMNGTGTYDEKLAAADATITRWITSRNVNVTWALDGETGQVFGAQGDGPLLGWPSQVVTYLYPEGSWLFLDGGELDLGIVRDSTLNSTNDFQMFYESWEGAHFHGIESYRLTLDLCPDGTTSGTVDIDPCSTGS